MKKNPQLQRFGEKIRALRQENGLTQEDLAELSGLHRTYIGGVERGERNITLLSALRIAKALHVPPSQLLNTLDE